MGRGLHFNGIGVCARSPRDSFSLLIASTQTDEAYIQVTNLITSSFMIFFPKIYQPYLPRPNPCCLWHDACAKESTRFLVFTPCFM